MPNLKSDTFSYIKIIFMLLTTYYILPPFHKDCSFKVFPHFKNKFTMSKITILNKYLKIKNIVHSNSLINMDKMEKDSIKLH